ncbi:MAG: S1 RNA-binding domain-containing protein [Parasporobacterium sp.]|nr:S1 RNA-binding domain-containing protein [Parasporobacterium sp.]
MNENLKNETQEINGQPVPEIEVPETPAAPEAPAVPEEPEVVESMEDYSRELESSLRKIHEGDVMEGEVIAFNEHGVILDLSYYATGRVPVEEMSADPSFNIMTDVQIGDRFQAIVKSVDDGKGNILLSKKAAETEYSWDILKRMKEEKTVITGTVSETVRAGAIMYVEGIRGFIPASKLDVKYVEDTSPYLGRKLSVQVFEVDEERQKLILSAKELATQAYMEQQEASISRLQVGSIVQGTVESLQNYGAFVDLGDGISGLLHISEISDTRIAHPKAVLRTGQTVSVMIRKIENGKVSLSMKAVQEAKEQETEEEAREYRSEYVPNNPFADLLKDFLK